MYTLCILCTQNTKTHKNKQKMNTVNKESQMKTFCLVAVTPLSRLVTILIFLAIHSLCSVRPQILINITSDVFS